MNEPDRFSIAIAGIAAGPVLRTRSSCLPTRAQAFLRFLQQRGAIAADLARACAWGGQLELGALPKSLPPDQVEQMLAFCDRGTPVGQRDYAILLFLVRLGLRAGEVVALTLDDVDWERGEIVVRGKGQRLGRLPLPAGRRCGAGRLFAARSSAARQSS